MDSVLYTTVINPTEQSRTYGYLGAHGRTLAAGEQYLHPGNLLDQLASKPRQHAALVRDLDAGDLAIMSTPAPILWDNTADEAKVLVLADGTLGVTDSEFGPYSSSLH